MVYGENDYALKENNCLIFFHSTELALDYYSKNKLKNKFYLKNEVALTCDIYKSLQIIENRQVDESAEILNCINTMDDLIKTIPLEIPFRYRKSLYRFADYLTFERRIDIFFDKYHYERDFIRRGLLKVEKIILDNIIKV